MLCQVLMLCNGKMWLIVAHARLTLTIIEPCKLALVLPGMYVVVGVTLHLLRSRSSLCSFKLISAQSAFITIKSLSDYKLKTRFCPKFNIHCFNNETLIIVTIG